ncbi:MAG: alpha/beta fold hydrolase [Thermoleophilaceae bacterium]
MSEHFADVGPVTLCYETFGEPTDPALLLIMGLGTQMVAWRDDFCAQLAGRGFYVIRYDNRDCGRSTRMEGRTPTLVDLITRKPRALAYTLGDMAQDAVGLLDHLGIERAHVVGASMGGMIGQHLAFEHPARVLSLASIMSGAGGRVAGAPRLSILPLFLARPPEEGKEAYVERAVKLFKAIGSPKYFDEQSVRETVELSYDRGVTFSGTGRQLAAIVADGNRTSRLRRITAPTLVIQGRNDKLATPSGGKGVARAIPGARLMMVDGMGHDLPRGLWPKFIDAIADNAARAGDREPATEAA